MLLTEIIEDVKANNIAPCKSELLEILKTYQQQFDCLKVGDCFKFEDKRMMLVKNNAKNSYFIMDNESTIIKKSTSLKKIQKLYGACERITKHEFATGDKFIRGLNNEPIIIHGLPLSEQSKEVIASIPIENSNEIIPIIESNKAGDRFTLMSGETITICQMNNGYCMKHSGERCGPQGNLPVKERYSPMTSTIAALLDKYQQFSPIKMT